MSVDETKFWSLIASSRATATPELSDQAEHLQKLLEALPPQEIAAFDRLFARFVDEAYTWDLWAAAYIIGGGCSDDGFTDFRAGLIGLGRDVFHAAVRDPGTLIQQPARGVDFFNEELTYAARQAYEAVTGDEMPEDDLVRRQEPLGERWDEDTVDAKYPELAKKFGS